MILVFILCFIRRRFLAFLSLLLVNSSFWAFVYIWNTLESRSLSYYGPHLRHRPRWSTVVFRFVCVNFDYPPQIRVFWAWSYLSKPLYLYKSKDIRFPLGVSSSALFAKFDALFWLTFHWILIKSCRGGYNILHLICNWRMASWILRSIVVAPWIWHLNSLFIAMGFWRVLKYAGSLILSESYCKLLIDFIHTENCALGPSGKLK